MEERIMENTIYGLFQETVNKYRNNVAIIENKRTMTFGELSDMVDMILQIIPIQHALLLKTGRKGS